MKEKIKKKWILLFLLPLFSVTAEESFSKKIEELKKQKKSHLLQKRAYLRAAQERRGDPEGFLDAKRAYDLAGQEEDRIRAIERQIEKLEKEDQVK